MNKNQIQAFRENLSALPMRFGQAELRALAYLRHGITSFSPLLIPRKAKSLANSNIAIAAPSSKISQLIGKNVHLSFCSTQELEATTRFFSG